MKDNCSFGIEVLDQKKMCSEIQSVVNGLWIGALQKRYVCLCDTKDSNPIELLIDADVAGTSYSDRKIVLSCGLVVIETARMDYNQKSTLKSPE